MRTRISLMLPLICVPLAFWGCGDDSSSTKAKGDSAEVSADSDIVVGTFDDLPVCSDKRKGATAYVKDEKTAYICEDGKWEEDGEDSGEEGDSKDESSSSRKSKSSSSVDADDDDSEGETSSSSKMKSSSSSFKYEQDESAYVQPEVVKVKDKSVAGVSQKGPFVTGSAVKLYELDGETYAQTGKSFTGKISSDKGEFSVSSVTLASQYALLEASGYFRNEVTGKKSSGTIALNALTDLSDRENVNINLLTHLEYERALYLVGTGINVSAAKKQAEAEIFNAFGIQGDFANSEDLNIFSSGDGNAALLAFSVLMQGDRSEAELTELLTKLAIDIEKDGEWNDEATKSKIADWAMNQDLAGGLETIRSNINGWDLGTVPDFEKHVRNFWYANYGLGICDDDSKGVVKAVANRLSKFYGSTERYVCKSGTWVYASDVEKDTYEWTAGEDGEIKNGDVVDTNKYVYDEGFKAWRKASFVDIKLGSCTVSHTGEFGSITNGAVTEINKYYCYAGGWVSLMGDWSWDLPKEVRLNPEIEYGTMTDERDGQTYKTVVVGSQTWMAENLNYADSVNTSSLKGKSWCYDNDPKKCAVTGRLYTWAAAIDSVALANDADNPQICGLEKKCDRLTTDALAEKPIQGVCPNGWHLPSIAEWNALFAMEVHGAGQAGKALKSASGWNGSGNGLDSYGFAILPAGNRDGYGYFVNVGDCAFFWSGSNGFRLYIYSLGDYVAGDSSSEDEDNGFSVRCLRDSE